MNVVPPYTGLSQPSVINVRDRIQPEDGPKLVPPLPSRDLWSEPPLARADIWSAMQTWGNQP